MCVLRLRFEGRSGEFVRNMLAQHGFIAAGEVILVVCVCVRVPYLHGFDVQTTR